MTKLTLHNFRGFEHAEVAIAPATTFVGPNDAGKSTILEAIRFLFSPVDRGGHAWQHADVARRVDAPDGEVQSGGLNDEGTWVIARFEQLSSYERRTWGQAVLGGALEFGARLSPIRHTPSWEFPGRFGTAVLTTGPTEPQDEASFGDMVVQPGDGRSWQIAGEALASAIGERTGNYDAGDVFVKMPTVVDFPGPDMPLPGLETLLRPLLLRRLTRGSRARRVDLDSVALSVRLATNDVLSIARSRVEDFIDGVEDLKAQHLQEAQTRDLDDWSGIKGVADSLLSFPSYELHVRGERVNVGGANDPTSRSGRLLGAGKLREVRLAALGAYADPSLWPSKSPLLLLIEEPEVGLHPGAQRRMAAWLNSLATHSRQVLIVTHSTPTLDQAPPESIRIVQVELARSGLKSVTRHDEPASPESKSVMHGWATVGDPTLDIVQLPRFVARRWISEDLSDLARLMGTRPSDALIASRFLVVEGRSDESILRRWAQLIGLPSGRDVAWIPADGYSPVELVTKTLSISQPGAPVDVILDAGPDSSRQGSRIARAHESRVRVQVLSMRAIEEYFPVASLRRWLANQGVEQGVIASGLRRYAEVRGTIENRLDAMCGVALHRTYNKAKDGNDIANLMRPNEVPAEIVSVLRKALGSDLGSDGKENTALPGTSTAP